MSININWENLTSGEDGEALAEAIRAFIHDRFQQVELPKMIRSVHVHSFDFGTIAPEIELKDVSDPLPDFYEDSDDDGEDDLSPMSEQGDDTRSLMANMAQANQSLSTDAPAVGSRADHARAIPHQTAQSHSQPMPDLSRRHSAQSQSQFEFSPFISRAATPGIPGGTSNMSSFHQSFGTGFHVPATPLAAMAGSSLANAWLESHAPLPRVQEYDTPSLATPDLHTTEVNSAGFPVVVPPLGDSKQSFSADVQPDRSVEDVQIVMRLRYAGDIRMTLTADILLDYPMPSFVGIPLQIKLTGLSFDGVAILAYIKRKAHFCFLSPEDAEALVGHESALHHQHDSPESPQETRHGTYSTPPIADSHGSQEDSHNTPHDFSFEKQAKVHQVGGLFEDIYVESEIGEKASGKQVLKNVSKVEKFILEQVRRIFETEFVHPNFWTFLV